MSRYPTKAQLEERVKQLETEREETTSALLRLLRRDIEQIATEAVEMAIDDLQITT